MTRLYDVTTLDIQVFTNAKVLGALEQNLPAAGGTLAGCWVSDIGDLSRVMILREFPDAGTLIEARERMLLADDPLGVGQWTLSLQSGTYGLFPFLPEIAPAKLGPCYEMRTYCLKHGSLAPTVEGWRGAVAARHALSPLVGAMYALDGAVPRFLNIWAYSSTDERNRLRAEAVRQGIWPPAGGPAHLTTMSSSIYVPAAFSPLQ